MSFPFDSNDMAFPGLESVLETVQNQFWWGRSEQQTFLPATISGAARDAGNTVPDVLRGGLLLGRVATTGYYMEWNPAATDGTEVIAGILAAPLKMTDATANTDRFSYIFVSGNVYSDRLTIKDAADEGIVGHASEWLIASQLQGLGCKLDKHYRYGGLDVFRPRIMSATEISGNAITITDLALVQGRTFLSTGATGAMTVTVPGAKPGIVFKAASNVNQTMTVKAASGVFMAPGGIAIAYGTGIPLGAGECATFTGIAADTYFVSVSEVSD